MSLEIVIMVTSHYFLSDNMLFSSFIVTLNLEKNLREYYSVIYKLKIKSNLLKAHTIIFTFFSLFEPKSTF